MSLVPSGPSTQPEGLEDFAPSDRVVPTLRINHKESVVEDSLSGAKYSELTVVLLGLIKQRVLWPPDMGEEKEQPLCRSYNFTEGHPSPPEEKSLVERFPWEAAGYGEPPAGWEGIVLPCGSCKLKDWGTHPRREAPWCSEQHTFAMLLPTDEGALIPVLFQIQRSALKPSKNYLSSFANAGQPLFTVFTKITLEARKRGSNDYSVPKFVRGQATPPDLHAGFSQTYRSIREYVQTPRAFSGEGAAEGDEVIPETPDGSTAATMTTPAPAAPPAPPAPQSAPAPPTAAPAPPAPAQTAPSAPWSMPAPPTPAAGTVAPPAAPVRPPPTAIEDELPF